jgi:hypothetical protein
MSYPSAARDGQARDGGPAAAGRTRMPGVADVPWPAWAADLVPPGGPCQPPRALSWPPKRAVVTAAAAHGERRKPLRGFGRAARAGGGASRRKCGPAEPALRAGPPALPQQPRRKQTQLPAQEAAGATGNHLSNAKENEVLEEMLHAWIPSCPSLSGGRLPTIRLKPAQSG